MKILRSGLDQSVNFILDEKTGTGSFEARYVRRSPEYFICYLSSHAGCNMGCRFCHLTATQQTSMRSARLSDFSDQLGNVFAHYSQQDMAQMVHFNWMARGEALMNPTVLTQWNNVHELCMSAARGHNLIAKFNISTILPDSLEISLAKIFNGYYPTIYYSLYSMDKSFRDKWLPRAMPVEDALLELKAYQRISKKIIKFHYALIKGENDRDKDIEQIAEAIHDLGLHVEFNIVRYNPYSPDYGEESERINRYGAKMSLAAGCKVEVVDRVGFDVKASCGMFIE